HELRGEADRAKQEAVERAEALAKANREAQLHVARLARERGRSLCEAGDFSRGLLWLTHSLQLAPDGEAVGGALSTYLGYCRLCCRPLKGILRDPSDIRAAAFSPDGQTIVTASLKDGVRFWNAATLQPTGLALPHDSAVRGVVFSPDGQTLATVSEQAVRFW